jgi:hypothetical protein
VFSKKNSRPKKNKKYIPSILTREKKRKIRGYKRNMGWGEKFSCVFKRAQLKRLKDNKHVISHKIINKCNTSCEVRIHVHLCAEDLKSSPLPKQ